MRKGKWGFKQEFGQQIAMFNADHCKGSWVVLSEGRTRGEEREMGRRVAGNFGSGWPKVRQKFQQSVLSFLSTQNAVRQRCRCESVHWGLLFPFEAIRLVFQRNNMERNSQVIDIPINIPFLAYLKRGRVWNSMWKGYASKSSAKGQQ